MFHVMFQCFDFWSHTRGRIMGSLLKIKEQKELKGRRPFLVGFQLADIDDWHFQTIFWTLSSLPFLYIIENRRKRGRGTSIPTNFKPPSPRHLGNVCSAPYTTTTITTTTTKFGRHCKILVVAVDGMKMKTVDNKHFINSTGKDKAVRWNEHSRSSFPIPHSHGGGS